jgi:hypothetical protein
MICAFIEWHPEHAFILNPKRIIAWVQEKVNASGVELPEEAD